MKPQTFEEWLASVLQDTGITGLTNNQISMLLARCEKDNAEIVALREELARVNDITPDFYGYVWDYDNPEDSNEDTFGEYLYNQCDQECGPILGMERRVMVARKLPDVLLTVTEVDERNRPKAWSVGILSKEVSRG